MAVDNLIYQGINRTVSDYTGAKACEELINLRPTEGGLVPVKDFDTMMSNVAFRRVFVHHTTTGDNYLAVRIDDDACLMSLVEEDGDVLTDLYSTPYLGGSTIEGMHFATTGNILLLSLCDKEYGVYDNAAWTWNGSSYAKTEAKVPKVTVTPSASVITGQVSIVPLVKESEKADIVSAVENGINAAQENNPDLCVGPVIIATAFKTKDGKTFWTGNWMVYDPIPAVNADDRFFLSAMSSWFRNPVYVNFGYYNVYDHAYSLIPLTDNGTQGGYEVGQLDTITVPGAKVTLTLSKLDTTHPAYDNYWNEDTSIIQSIEVYASKPVSMLDASGDAIGYYYDGSGMTASLIVPQRSYDKMELDSQILYLQASVPLASLAQAAQTITLSFGGNIQMTEDTLVADAGALRRYGRLLSYNARFHYYDSVAKIEIGMPSFTQTGSGATESADIFVRYADESGNEGLYYLGTKGIYRSVSVSNTPTLEVISQSLNVKEVIIMITGTGVWHVEKYRMNPSGTYNYSICYEGPYDVGNAYQQSLVQYLISAKSNRVVTDYEQDVVNVTEQYNPFVFLVEHSYKAPGNVIDVQPQMAGIVDASYGRDPLNVFTERGLYALTQGSANVLYGAFLPLSNLKSRRGAIPVEMGTFFLADGALWLVSGRQVTLVSEALSLGPHKYVRACPGYKKISGQDTSFSPTPVVASPYYDVSPYLSSVEFKTFAEGGQLGYNRFRQELFISNASYGYTYVLSLKYRQWFKLSRRLWQDQPGGVIICTPYGTGTISVLDMATEVNGTVLAHMQSRPFSMGYQYIHIRRIVAMIRAKLSGLTGQKLAVAIYGSDNLQDWKLLSYANREGGTDTSGTDPVDDPLYISQVRTAPSARSWRYYTICIGGPIQAGGDFHTDIGPVLVDYEPVIRRIG